MINGIINVYKEAGYTSFDVVAKLRKITHQKKIGHTGTLDPDATGVLPVCFGNATKLVDLMTDKRKEYIATMVLGKTTDTYDISGQVLEEKMVNCTADDVTATINEFVGDIMQVPPMYSALKVDGKKLCDLAREGKTVERKARPVTIFAIEILDVDLPNIKMRVECSKGTYIRSLCYDIGIRLGCGGTMTSLIRTRSGAFDIEHAYNLSQIEEYVNSDSVNDIVLNVDAVFEDYAYATVSGETLRLCRNGNTLSKSMLQVIPGKDNTKVRIYDDNGTFFAVYELKGSYYGVYKMFL